MVKKALPSAHAMASALFYLFGAMLQAIPM